MKKVIKISFFLGITFLLLLAVNGQSRKELEKQRSKKEKEIAVTKRKLQETKKKKEKSEEVLTTLRRQISQKRELAGIYLNEIEKIDLEINHLNEDVTALNFEITKLKTEFGNLVVQGFKSRHAASKINFLFSANTFPQTVRRFIYLKKLLDFRKKQLGLILVKKYEKAKNLAEMEQIKAEKLGIVKSNDKIKNELEEDENSAEVLVSELQIKETTLQADLRKKQKAYHDLDAALKRAIEKEIELARKKAEEAKQKEMARLKEKNKNKPPAKDGTKKPEEEYVPPADISTFGKMKSKLPWPVQGGRISQGFGSHRHPNLPDVTVINNGINIAGTSGSTVKCVYEGEVSTILKIPGMKNTLLVKHGDYFTVYSKLETVTVTKGAKLKTGQSIGTLGTDSDGKTELHFEVWQGNQRMDPAKWLHSK
ncbi:MAG: murein hydrolase activator EnvC family protein [Bacteroidia bacterium]